MRYFAPFLGLSLLSCLALAGCDSTADAPATPPPAQPQTELNCGESGELRTELYGALAAEIDWGKHDLECTGMPRPEGRGARLRFAGNSPDDDRTIAIIIAIPDLARDALGEEYRSNVTLIEEGAGRFFSTPNLDNCLTDITSLTPLDADGDKFSIGGILYCVAPLPEINGDSSVLISELRFSGLLDWSAS